MGTLLWWEHKWGNRRDIPYACLCWTVGLFRIPHKPPAGFLRVLHAPARQGGIRRVSKTKINNLGTDEFVSNPPILKNRKPGFFKKSFKFRNSCEKTLSNNLVFEPMNFPRSPHE